MSRPRVRKRRRWPALLMAGVVVFLSAWIVIPAMTAPGNDGLAAKIAESARDRGFGFLVTGLEAIQYRLAPPAVGGHLDVQAQRALAGDAAPSPGAVRSPATARDRSDVVVLQPRIVPVVAPALRGEGVYVARVMVDGRPAIQTALLRPDRGHTSYLAGVAWMSSKLLRFEQHPGAGDPGQLGRWSTPPTVPAAARAALAATFNSGFKTYSSRGAYYQNGRQVGQFATGGASFVVYRDGHAAIGAWGRDVRLTSDVVSVRQNLGLLVEGGRPARNLNASVQSAWGATLGGATYTWRSGVGVTAAGDVVFVAGDALSATTLALLLQRAGAVRAMELDINRSWVSYMWYSHSGRAATPHKLVDFRRPADRYFTVNSRDFFAVYTR